MSELVLRLEGASLRSLAPVLTWGARSAAGAPVDLRLSRARIADVRWLWEDPAAEAYDATSGRRRRAELAVAAVGARLGWAFASTPAMRALLQRALAGPHPAVRIVGDARVLALPWELATTPAGRFVVGRAGGLARSLDGASPPVARPRRRPGPPRVLVVVSRPSGARDVGYLAVAGTVLERLEGRAEVRLVRPGTLAALVDALAGGAWDYVHFDGHGVPGGLLFEDGCVSARTLGRALGRQDGRAFTLNACSSAVAAGASSGSVARALLHAGASGVVAMGAAVRVSSAAAFFEHFYAATGEGWGLARACAAGRMALRTDALAGVADWAVPVLYLAAAEPAARRRRRAPRPAPSRSADPFVGRDGELFTLDRMMDEPGAVLVHGAAGTGKTTLAEHLLDWRRRSGAAERVFAFGFRGAPSLDTLCNALEDEAATTAAAASEPVSSARPVAERLEALGRRLAGDAVVRDFLFDGADALLPAGEGAAPACTSAERRAFLRLVEALRGAPGRVVITARRGHTGIGRLGVRPFRLGGVKEPHRAALLRAWAGAFGSWGRVEARVQSARGRGEVDELLRVLDGHPLATRTAAHALRSRSVRAVADALRAGDALPAPPPGAGDRRSYALDDLLADVGDAAVDPSVGLLGLFRGCFGEGELAAFLARPELPAALRPADAAAAARRALAAAAALGVAAPAASPRRWALVPGAAAAMDARWRRGLDEDAVRGVELAFVRAWEAAVRRHRLPDGDPTPAGLAIARRAEGSLRRALDLADAHGEWRAAYPLVSLLNHAWTGARRADADALVARWMKRAEEAPGPLSGDSARLDVWRLAAGQHARRLASARRFRPALALYRKIARTLEGADDLHAENLAVNAFMVGDVHQERGALRAAAAAYHEALSRWEALGDRGGEWRACHALGTLEEDRGRLDEARRWYVRALALDEALDDPPGAAQLHLCLGRLELRRDRLGAAEAWYRAGLALLAPFPDEQQNVAVIQSDLGLVALQRGRHDEAEEWFRSALAIHRAHGSAENVSAVCHQLGLLEHERGSASPWVGEERERFAAAERWYRRSARIDRRRGDRVGAARSYHHLGLLEQDREDLAAAERWYRRALAGARDATDPEDLGAIHAQLGRCLAQAGRPGRAAGHLVTGWAILARAESPLAAQLEPDLAALAARLGRERFTRLWRARRAPAAGLQAALSAAG